MKHAFAVICMLFMVPVCLAAGPHDWENPEMIGSHKEPAHATLVPYADAASALAGDREASPWFMLLNGDWKFHWVKKTVRTAGRFLSRRL